MNHLEALNSFGRELEQKPEPLALLVFGSVAKETYHPKSDIDTFIIYRSYPGLFKFDTTFYQGIKLGMSHLDFNHYRKSVIEKPYTKYVFTTSRVVFDKSGKVQHWITAVKRYFSANPDIQAEWVRLNEAYEQEKRKYGAGRSSIFEVYKMLEQKYTGRVLQEEIP
ncbi:nucleotidyltransferase domain-containing protein [Candidatus Gottesmanbacteria bacterium]|nr:nucleotidyltransferase domain-containing protein [Candidatus Gottesmanbacteria bacterium]